MTEWSQQMQSLIEWFGESRHRMPQAPFKISASEKVTDIPHFYASLEQDIADGPAGPRAYLLEKRRIILQRVAG